ncbi:MAG: hypothetical protein KDA96_15340, partial [Planctomycetaceae bacterium]|nr:hypothetical protein [Planctomycetaceae bacterium]
MRPDISILYRGPLSSCNYSCGYCPFAKRHETVSELRTDADALTRFVNWVNDYGVNEHRGGLSILLTPWGEALHRRWYQDAVQRLSNMSHITKIAAQTNLSCHLEWLDGCDAGKVGLWC